MLLFELWIINYTKSTKSIKKYIFKLIFLFKNIFYKSNRFSCLDNNFLLSSLLPYKSYILLCVQDNAAIRPKLEHSDIYKHFVY